jgi:hypothetical protein
MAPKKQPKNAFQRFMDNLKIGYFTGQNPIARSASSYGFMPTKNAALNLGKLLINIPYDPEMRIKKNDPMAQNRRIVDEIGKIERIHNAYLKPRVKLAD